MCLVPTKIASKQQNVSIGWNNDNLILALTEEAIQGNYVIFIFTFYTVYPTLYLLINKVQLNVSIVVGPSNSSRSHARKWGPTL